MTPDPDSPEAQAKHRFQVISLTRLSGIGLMIVGFLLWRTNLLGVQAETIGAVSVVIGALLSLVLPRVLIRRWRDPS